MDGVIVSAYHKGKAVVLAMTVETYLRKGQRGLQRWMLDPKVRGMMAAAAYGGGGFLLSAAGVGGYPQPLALGLISAVTGWRAVLMTLGAMVGYPTFWGSLGNPGIVWSAAGGLLAVLAGSRQQEQRQPWMMPILTAFLTAVTELAFLLILRSQVPLPIRALRVGLALLTGVLFAQTLQCRDPITDWLAGGVIVLALARVWLGPYLGFGYLASGVLAVSGAFPAGALAGLGLDLARVTKVPMTAVACMAYFLRMVPWDKRWQHYAAPGAAYLVVSAAVGIWDPGPLPSLVLGGALGAVLPPRPQVSRRRGETGAAQVRLEMGASVMGALESLVLEMEPPPVDGEALVEKARLRACSSCSLRKHCKAEFSALLLQDPLEADCRKQGRLLPELQRSREQWKAMVADRARRWEYRQALGQQYRFLGAYLRSMADRLPRRWEERRAAFRIEASARSREKERSNGDRCIAFPGMDCRYYVLLCDGMGTGLGAAQEGQQAAALLRQLLTAGFPAEHSLATVNSFLALSGKAGAATIDLAEIGLDTGVVTLYKWGAAPSWILSRQGAKKIGTATPPPGISVQEIREVREKLSLRRGEVLFMLSDGVDGEGAQCLAGLSQDAPPGELAETVLARGCGQGEDDATVAAIRLRPVSLGPS